MSWQDRDYADDDPRRGMGRPGGDWRGLRPSFDNPLSWSLSLFRVIGITVRVHILFAFYIVVQLLIAAIGPQEGGGVSLSLLWMAITMAILFVIVLLHEFGHCIACRKVGGFADEILMWPLGGLAYCQPPRSSSAHFITAAGGPFVNVMICAITVPLVGFMTGVWWGAAIPNPFKPMDGMIDATTYVEQVVYLINVLSWILLLFNLLPIFPLDGGRLVQALLWPKMGYANSMRIAVRVGFIGAIMLAIAGMVMREFMLVGIALFGGLTCWLTLKQLEFTDDMLGGEAEMYAQSMLGEEISGGVDAKPTRAERRAMKQAQQEAEEARQVDTILAKIARTGIDSLSGSERRLLNQHSERKRNAGAR